MQTQMKMSREAEKIFNLLDEEANNAGVQGFIIPAHIYICDRLILTYYTKPLLENIERKIDKIPTSKREYKHYTVEYWAKIMDNMFKDNIYIHRDEFEDIEIGSDNLDGFTHIISNFLINNYSLDDAMIINTIVNTNDLKSIISACDIAKSAGVYNIKYVKAVLENESAKQQIREKIIEHLGNKIDESDKLLQGTVHTHTPIEMAQIQYNWDRKRQDSELERMFNKMVGDK